MIRRSHIEFIVNDGTQVLVPKEGRQTFLHQYRKYKVLRLNYYIYDQYFPSLSCPKRSVLASKHTKQKFLCLYVQVDFIHVQIVARRLCETANWTRMTSTCTYS